MQCIEIDSVRGIVRGIRVVNVEVRDNEGKLTDGQKIVLGNGEIFLGNGKQHPEVDDYGRMTNALAKDGCFKRDTKANTANWFLLVVRTAEVNSPNKQSFINEGWVKTVTGNVYYLETRNITSGAVECLIKMEASASIVIKFAGDTNTVTFCPEKDAAHLFAEPAPASQGATKERESDQISLQ